MKINSIEDLANIMIEYNLSVRAIPMKVRETYDLSNKDKFPDSEIIYLPEYKREMVVRYIVPKNAGKFICVKNHGTCSSTDFYNTKTFDTIQEAVENYLEEYFLEI